MKETELEYEKVNVAYGDGLHGEDERRLVLGQLRALHLRLLSKFPSEHELVSRSLEAWSELESLLFRIAVQELAYSTRQSGSMFSLTTSKE